MITRVLRPTGAGLVLLLTLVAGPAAASAVGIQGPGTAGRGSVVTITGTASPGAGVQVWFHKQNTTGYTLRRHLTADRDGRWSTSYLADVDYRYYAVSGGSHTPTVLTKAVGTTIGGPLLTTYGGRVVLQGLAAPGRSVQVYFHQRGTEGYQPLDTVLTAGSDGRYSLAYYAGDDYRYHAVAAGYRSTAGHTIAAVVATSADNGGTVDVQLGRRLAVTLSSNPSTGYSWHVTTAPDATVLRTDESYFVAPTNTAMVGVPGTYLQMFTAVGRGTASMLLTYVGPTGVEGDTFRLTTRVS